MEHPVDIPLTKDSSRRKQPKRCVELVMEAEFFYSIYVNGLHTSGDSLGRAFFCLERHVYVFFISLFQSVLCFGQCILIFLGQNFMVVLALTFLVLVTKVHLCD